MNICRFLRMARGQGAPAHDTIPDPFDFPDQTDVPLSTVIVSDTISITGISEPTPISIIGGEYQIEDGAWTSASGTIENNQALTLRHTSSGSLNAPTTTTVTIGGVSDNFKSTTVDADTTPDSFSFTAVTNATLSTAYDSNTVTITGINTDAPVTAAGGTVSINGGSAVTSGTIASGQTLQAHLTSSASYSTLAQVTVDVGGIVRTYDVTTAPAPSPTPTPTPTPSETIQAPKAGAADYTVVFTPAMTASQRATAINNMMTTAYNAMAGSSTAPKKIAIPAGDCGNIFFTNRTYPSLLSVVPVDYDDPPVFKRFANSSGSGVNNVVFDGFKIEYTPTTFSDPVMSWNNCTNLTVSNFKITCGSGRPVHFYRCTDCTAYRLRIDGNGAGNNNYMFFVGQYLGSPSVNVRVIECALMNGRGGDGFRIMGVTNLYLARNRIKNLTKFSNKDDHCDAVQITQDPTTPLPNSLTCVGHLHLGDAYIHRFEGFQITNANVTNGKIILRDATIIGSEVNGAFFLGCPSPELENVRFYNFDYGDQYTGNPLTWNGAANQAPNPCYRGSTNVKLIGDCRGPASPRIDNSQGAITFDPGTASFNVDATYDLGTNAAARDVIEAAWNAANPGVPT